MNVTSRHTHRWAFRLTFALVLLFLGRTLHSQGNRDPLALSSPSALNSFHGEIQAAIDLEGQIAAGDTQSSVSLEDKHSGIAAELRLARLEEEQQTIGNGDIELPPPADASRVDILKQIEVVIAQQQSATSANEDHDAKIAALKSTLTRLAGGALDEQPPYSILLLDSLKESVRNAKARLESAESSLLAARQAAESAKKTADERAKTLRQLKEVSSTDGVPSLGAAELEQKLAVELLVLRRQELAIAEANSSIAHLQLEIDLKQVGIIGEQVVFSKATLDQKLEEFDTLEIDLKRRAEKLQTELQFAEKRWLAARQEADSTPNSASELIERVDSLKVSQLTIQNELSLINQRLQRIPVLRTAWNRRFLVTSNQAERQERRVWVEETDVELQQVANQRRARLLRVDELRVGLANVNAKIDALSADATEGRRWLQAKRDALNAQMEANNSSLLVLDNSQRTLERLKVQIEGEPRRTVSEIAEDVWLQANRIWNYELTYLNDTSLTVGKVCSAVLLLFFGFLVARWLSTLLGRRLPKIGIDEAAAHAIESLSFYAMLLTFALTALRYANVPLTVFTFLGGAIAIGVGFGSQNILNNFISGLILLAERPIKVGDLIILDDAYGNVTKIGARSTTIRTGENREIVVPNSKFLENNVTNLTRRDDQLRTSITIGVAYGSDLDCVMRLLERAAAQQSGVLDRPKPMVWFNDFGDNSLVFQVHFWVQAKNLTQVRMIETGVRLRIDAMFREANVVIAFPQRDLHVQSLRPIEFRLVPPVDTPHESNSKAA